MRIPLGFESCVVDERSRLSRVYCGEFSEKPRDAGVVLKLWSQSDILETSCRNERTKRLFFCLFCLKKGVKRKRKLQLRDDPPCDRPRAKPAKPKPCDKSVKPCDKPLKPVKAQSQSHSAVVVDAEDGAETCAWAHATLRVLGAAPQGVADPQHAERVASADLHFLLEGPADTRPRRPLAHITKFCSFV